MSTLRTTPRLRPIETLEPRRLLSVTVEDGSIVFRGTEGQDQVAVWRNGAGDFVVWVDGQTQTVDGDNVNGFEAIGYGGNDVLRVDFNLALRATLDGGSGDDRLIGGAASDLMLGGDGLDRFYGNAGNDTLDGGAGNDQLFGADGRDTADYSDRTGNLNIQQFPASGSSNFGFAGELDDAEEDLLGLDVERVLGGSGNDRFVGGDQDNTFVGGDGNDTINGNGGNDALQGQGGNDSLFGGTGNDFLDGGEGDDSMYGQSGNDTLLGRDGNDRLFANDNARDTVNGGGDSDTATVDGADVVTGVETRA